MDAHFFVALAIGLVGGLLLLSVLWWLDRYEIRSGLFALIPALWAAFVLPFFHSNASAVGFPKLLFGSLVELLVLIPGLLVVFGLGRFFQGPVDGWLLGTLGGLGLALAGLVDTYSVAGSLLSSRHLPTVLGIIFSVVLEIGVASFLGAALGWGRVSHKQSVALGCFPATLLVALTFKVGILMGLMHAGTWLFFGLVLVVTLGWLGLLLYFLHFEAQLLQDELREEVDLRVLPQWSLDRFPFRRQRLRSDWGANLGERRVLNSMALHLAFRKHALRRGSAGGPDLKGLEIVRLREGLKARLAVLQSPTKT